MNCKPKHIRAANGFGMMPSQYSADPAALAAEKQRMKDAELQQQRQIAGMSGGHGADQAEQMMQGMMRNSQQNAELGGQNMTSAEMRSAVGQTMAQAGKLQAGLQGGFPTGGALGAPQQDPRLQGGASGLLMQSGGEVSPWSLKGIYQKLTGPQLTASQKWDAAHPPAQQQAPAQTTQTATAPTGGIGAYVGNDALKKREAAAGLRKGGELRTGHGGAVPGKGKGDKIPAKYEPGEFVVSNDMLKAAPELRGHLRGLRKRVLAEKGMTVQQADANVVSGGAMKAQSGGMFGNMFAADKEIDGNITNRIIAAAQQQNAIQQAAPAPVQKVYPDPFDSVPASPVASQPTIRAGDFPYQKGNMFAADKAMDKVTTDRIISAQQAAPVAAPVQQIQPVQQAASLPAGTAIQQPVKYTGSEDQDGYLPGENPLQRAGRRVIGALGFLPKIGNLGNFGIKQQTQPVEQASTQAYSDPSRSLDVPQAKGFAYDMSKGYRGKGFSDPRDQNSTAAALNDPYSNAAIIAANPGGAVRKTVNANGTTSYSGGNVSGVVGFTDANGKALAGGPKGGFAFANKPPKEQTIDTIKRDILAKYVNGTPEEKAIAEKQWIGINGKQQVPGEEYMTDVVTDERGNQSVVATSKRTGQTAQGQQAQAAPSNGVHAPTSKAEYDKLPKGAKYTHPDGTTRTKG